MKFRTTCSHCASVFLLSSEQLDAAQGWAQCSVCGGAFNARSTLASENGDLLPVEPREPLIEAAPEPAPVVPPEEPPSEIPHAIVQNADPTSMPEAATVSHLGGIDARVEPPPLTSIILIDPDAEVTDDYGPMPVFAATSDIQGDAREAESIYGPKYSPAVAQPKPSKPIFTPPPPIAAAKSSPHVPARRTPTKIILWSLLSAILFIALALQLTYFLRDVIVLKIPATRPALENACVHLGCNLSLPKNAELMQIIGSDLQTDSAGAGLLTLKLTLGNRAPYTQTWPVLVLTLTDAKGQPQARRSFAPSEYLTDPKLLVRGMPARSEYPLSLPLQVRNLPMTGYHLAIAY